ncbi:hypothetical protein NLU13_4138 [Sarocladium strictum]|uniref:ABC transporter n=1 Tax=Sarocladium strictum TaxID=5046 RepID=A0AA39GIB0_SARSR|nr:hypothetical protein NLU13_4138 [Sarocladium strictum]
MRAPLRFFTTVDSGITLNRFSQDMTLIDENLPMTFFTTTALALRVVAETGLVASGATYVAAIIPACILVLYLVQKYYLQTSRQMRLLDIETKSPLYTQFTETLAGLPTIRAFGWSTQLLYENHRRLDASQKPFYGMYCIQRWLQIVLDLFVAGMAVVLVSFALGMANTTSTGAIGLALVNLIGFNRTLTLLVDQWSELETSLGAIARLKWFYSSTPDENKPEEKEEPPAGWPACGSIEFRNVSASYSDELPLVLKEVNLAIEPGQKVGICGRSGSGKSTLVLTLPRLLELREGEVTIDGQDISKMPRSTLRTRLTTMPQGPLTVPGTVRHNLDPASVVQSDAPLIAALEKVALWEPLSRRGGLDAVLLDLGLSSGQLQLLCLARAMLSRGSIVILDEATSNVDHQTEEEIRRVIKEEMSDRTVLEVAHRDGPWEDFKDEMGTTALRPQRLHWSHIERNESRDGNLVTLLLLDHPFISIDQGFTADGMAEARWQPPTTGITGNSDKIQCREQLREWEASLSKLRAALLSLLPDDQPADGEITKLKLTDINVVSGRMWLTITRGKSPPRGVLVPDDLHRTSLLRAAAVSLFNTKLQAAMVTQEEPSQPYLLGGDGDFRPGVLRAFARKHSDKFPDESDDVSDRERYAKWNKTAAAVGRDYARRPEAQDEEGVDPVCWYWLTKLCHVARESDSSHMPGNGRGVWEIDDPSASGAWRLFGRQGEGKGAILPGLSMLAAMIARTNCPEGTTQATAVADTRGDISYHAYVETALPLNTGAVVVLSTDQAHVELGRPEELLSGDSAFRALWESQGL